jgi:electron transfer flavoprotein-quinone oxidoreductase
MASRYDVLVVGAGCAGLTAAIGLARAGFRVAVLEADTVVGGSGLLGGVCCADSLIQPDILGAEAAQTLPWERRLIERGSFATDGRRLAGYLYRDADAFFPCYTVLRSRFTRHLAELACGHEIALQTDTIVQSLIRDGRRIIGVATTRGPLYAPLVFLAEGDAGLLVCREGLDRASDSRDQPAFLYCLQQVLELPPRAIEERFGVGPDQGIAYDFLLRNPGAFPLNVRGQLCTNREGVTLSIVLPASNLHRWFTGEPRQLLDWFVNMPVLCRWLRDSQRGARTAALVRTGGLRDVPYLLEDGLAVGGAVAGLGTDFPVMNLIGPATATGALLSRAAARIRAEGLDFDRDALARHYLGPLQQTRCWRDMEFVQRWPGYRERAHVLFGHGLELLLDSASVWARPRRWLPWKFIGWLRVLTGVSWRQWNELRDECLQLGRVLRLQEVTPQPALARLLLDGFLNAFRDLVRRPRPHLPRCGTLRLHYHAVDEAGRASAVPWLFRRWFERFRPVLAAVGRILHANDDNPFSVKLGHTFALLLRQINLFDVLTVCGLVFPIAVMCITMSACRYVFPWKRKRAFKQVMWAERSETHESGGLDLEQSAHRTPPLIRITWRSAAPGRQAESVRDLPHICPVRVFEITGMPPEPIRVAVHAERCILCHACWRMNEWVDWGRNGAGSSPSSSHAVMAAMPPSELGSMLNELERKLGEFDKALGDGPALVERPHNDYLEMLARYAQQLAQRVRGLIHSRSEIGGASRRFILDLVDVLVARAEERTRHVWEGRFTWASADGLLLRQHHLAELRRLLAVPAPVEIARKPSPVLRLDWIPAAQAICREDASIKHLLADIAARRYLLETLEAAAAAKSVRAELLAVLITNLNDRLAVRMHELRSNHGDELSSHPPASKSEILQAYGRHGRCLLADVEETRKFLDVPGDWSKMADLRVLLAECEEIADSESRLLVLGSDWRESNPSPAIDELNDGFGQLAAYILAGKMLIGHTFDRVEKGDDAELAMLLLRVWLDHTGTLLDEYSILVRERLNPASRPGQRPLIEPESGAPLRTQSEYLAARSSYHSGDYLFVALDLLQPRLVPDMIGQEEIAVTGPDSEALLRMWNETRPEPSRHGLSSHRRYLAETVTAEMIGRYAAGPSTVFELERACTYLIFADMDQSLGALRDRCTILRALAEVVMPRLLNGDKDVRVRHLHRDAVEVEALKADFRRRLEAAWQAFGGALGRNADVQASCFALAEAAAWLKAADSTLGRMAWITRLCQAEEREEPASEQDLARRALAYCVAEIRDRHLRFDEDLAALRRGYYAPQVYAAAMLLRRAPR